MSTLDIIKELCKRNNTSIKSLEKELGYSNGSLAKARVIPSDRILELSKYFGVSMEYLMTGDETVESNPAYEQTENKEKYYINDETAAIAQDIFENKELRLLFDTARDTEPEDLIAVHNMLLALKRKERRNDD